MNNVKTAKLGLKSRLAYGSGDLASGLIYQGVGFFILIYWTNEALISPAAAGTILLVSRVFDGFTDIFFGRMVDKVKSRHGKARPWLLWLAVPFGLSAALVFWSPGSSDMINIVYAFVSYNIVMIIYTAVNIPYGVLNAKMTSDPVERGILGIFRGAGVLVSIVIVSVLAPLLVNMFNYTVAFFFLGVIASILILVTFAGTKEVFGNTADSVEYSFVESFGVLVRNLPWILMLSAGIILFTGGAVRIALTAYYAIYNMGNPGAIPILMMLMIPGMIVGMGFAPMMFKHLGKVKTSIYSNFAMVPVAMVFYALSLNGLTTFELYTFLLVSAVFFGTSMSGFFPMISDTIEYGQWKTGKRIEGLTYSAASMGTKVGGGIGGAIAAWGIAIVGFNATVDIQSDVTLAGIGFLYLWFPVITGTLYAVILMFNRSDKDRDELMAAITKQEAATQEAATQEAAAHDATTQG